MERRSFIRYGKPFVGESSEREAAWSSSAVCALVRREANRQALVACRDCSWGYRAFLPDEAPGGLCGRSSVLSAGWGPAASLRGRVPAWTPCPRLAGGSIEGVRELVEELDRQLPAFVGPAGPERPRLGFELGDEALGEPLPLRGEPHDRDAPVRVAGAPVDQAARGGAFNQVAHVRAVAAQRPGQVAYGRGRHRGAQQLGLLGGQAEGAAGLNEGVLESDAEPAQGLGHRVGRGMAGIGLAHATRVTRET